MEFCSLWISFYFRHNSLEGIFFEGNISMIGTVWNPNGCKEKTIKIINFRNRSHRRSWIIGNGFLMYGNGWGKSANFSNSRCFRDIRDNHSSVGRETLEISLLSFRIEGIKCEGRLSRSRNTRNHRQCIFWDFDIDIFEIMRLSSEYFYIF